MTIKIYSDRIDIGDFTLFEGNGGVQFDGVARAENFLGNQSFQGTVAGFSSGGQLWPGSPPGVNVNTIDKFPFAADTNATDVGDLTSGKYYGAGQSSTTFGYFSGGNPGPTNTIEKFSFSTNGNSTSIGSLTQARFSPAGQSSTVSGYTSGGSAYPLTPNTIDKFPFAADTNATDVGDLTQGRYFGCGQSSTTHGYVSAGISPPASPTSVVTIDKFPFAIDTNATDVGDLLAAQNQSTGQSSTTHGYATGNTDGNYIRKFPFATDTNGTDVGDLSQARAASGGSSSINFGYTSGGLVQAPVQTHYNTIDKFPFSADANASDVGDLTQGRFYIVGQQV